MDTSNSSVMSTDEIFENELRDVGFYHGYITYVEADELLVNDGDYLLRRSGAVPNSICLVLSVRTDMGVKHFCIVTNDTQQCFVTPEHKEKSITDLINYYQTSQRPINIRTYALLQKPVPRPAWLIDHKAIFVVEKLNEGAFTEVLLANYFSSKGKMQVAVKMLKTMNDRSVRLFLGEARMMRKLAHKNVVTMLGIAVHENPLLIVMEYCEGGSMLSYLRDNGAQMDAAMKLRFAIDVADGLSFLEKRNCIHGDIKTRNCLITSENVVKITGFLPVESSVKWLAPETLQDGVYSVKSDVWAFGVLLWEIYANGEEPYPEMDLEQTRNMVLNTFTTMRMPQGTPLPISCVSMRCWIRDPRMRPLMSTLHEQLKKMEK